MTDSRCSAIPEKIIQPNIKVPNFLLAKHLTITNNRYFVLRIQFKIIYFRIFSILCIVQRCPRLTLQNHRRIPVLQCPTPYRKRRLIKSEISNAFLKFISQANDKLKITSMKIRSKIHSGTRYDRIHRNRIDRQYFPVVCRQTDFMVLKINPRKQTLRVR